jgi:hypothetical protein
MARTYGRIKTSIWDDDDFRQLSEAAQRLYLLLISQPDLSMCGGLTYAPRRWASFSDESGVADIGRAFQELEQGRFILFDPDTEEVVVRTFLRHNDFLSNRNTLLGAARALASLHSKALVAAVANGLGDDARTALARGYATASPSPLPSPFEAPSIRGPNQALDAAQERDGEPAVLNNAFRKDCAEEAVDNDGDRRAADAIQLLAERDLAKLEARRQERIAGGARDRTLAELVAGRSLRDGPLAASLANQDPDLAPPRIANTIEPPEVVTPPAYEPEGIGQGVAPDFAAIREIVRGHGQRDKS